jgi:membrane protein YqaA with SNARE-associated domain
MELWIHSILSTLSLPETGLIGVFLIATVSATLLPLGSEPAVFALVKLHPDLFWLTILVATAGNTLGGVITWWMGYASHQAINYFDKKSSHELRALRWLEKLGPKACLLSWLPAVGDPLCAIAGWLRLPFWPCVFYMTIGKFTRYVLMTVSLSFLF